jgi:hypothetical protein
MGNEFVYSMLAQQNVETLNEAGVAKGSGKTIVASCPHCFNTIANEYPQLGGNYEVVHHTQLLARLVDEGKLTPVGEVKEKITYHDPCFLGRHNKVYTPPREIIDAVPGTQAEEMHRCKGRGFCCGAGGARMWMEERIGKRINTERIDEALALDPDTVSTACPYCLVMLGDAVAAKKGSGEAKEALEVIDVAQLLARSVALRRPRADGNGSADAAIADTEAGVDAAPPGDVTSAAEGGSTTTAEATEADGPSGPGTESAGTSPAASASPRDADGDAGSNAVEGRVPTFRPGRDGDTSAVTPSEVTGDQHPGDGGRDDDRPASGPES